MSKLSTHLNFNGNCLDAMKFYEQATGGKIQFKMTYGESPMPCPEGFSDKIMHASILIGGDVLMGADAPPDRYKTPQGITVSISNSDLDTAKKIFDALSEGGTAIMPFQETFWAKGFGMVTDKFGIPWMVNCEKPMNQ